MSSPPNTICRAPCRTHLFTWHGALPTPRTAKQRCAKIVKIDLEAASQPVVIGVLRSTGIVLSFITYFRLLVLEWSTRRGRR